MKRLWLILPVFVLFVSAGYLAVSENTEAGQEKEVVVKKKGGWLGVMMKEVHRKTADKAGLKEEKGAYIDKVVDDSPADSAGIKAGDVIIAFNNIEIEKSDDLAKAVQGAMPGETAKITLMRGGEQKTVSVVLGSAPKRAYAIAKRLRIPKPPKMPKISAMPYTKNFTWSVASGGYGFYLETLNEQLAEYFGAPDGKGVLIEKVREESDASKAGFQAGDVIVKAGKKTVEDVSDFKAVLGAFDPGEKIPVQILRKGKNMTIDLPAREEKEHTMRILGHGAPGLMKFYSDGEGHAKLEELRELEVLEEMEHMDMDIDVDIDMEELEDGMRELRIMLNGKELELDELREKLQYELQELHEDVDVEVDEEGGERTIRIRARKS